MNHLDDGTLQAFLDDELRPGERADAAEHLLGCRQCRSAKDELVQAHSVFAEAVSVLDVEVPETSAPVRRGWSAGGRAFVKAAGLILVVSAAASAAVPGSPVREWIIRAVRPEPVEAPATLEAVEPAPTPMPPAPAGVSLPVTAPVEVALSDLDGTTIRLVETDGDRVTVSALGGEVDPVFNTAADRIEVRGAVGGEITVEVPRAVRQLRLLVDGELYADRDLGELRVHVPAETVDGARVWR